MALLLAVVVGNSAFAYADVSYTGAECGKEISEYALSLTDVSYVSGGDSPEDGFDCSGFVQYVYATFDISISRITDTMKNEGEWVCYSEAQRGDLILYYLNGECTHCAIYLGDDLIVHASENQGKISVSSVTDCLYDDFYVRRLQSY